MDHTTLDKGSALLTTAYHITPPLVGAVDENKEPTTAPHSDDHAILEATTMAAAVNHDATENHAAENHDAAVNSDATPAAVDHTVNHASTDVYLDGNPKIRATMATGVTVGDYQWQ